MYIKIKGNSKVFQWIENKIEKNDILDTILVKTCFKNPVFIEMVDEITWKTIFTNRNEKVGKGFFNNNMYIKIKGNSKVFQWIGNKIEKDDIWTPFWSKPA